MRPPPAYTVFCLIVLGLFAYGRTQGIAPLSGGTYYPGGSGGGSSGSGGSSGFAYVGTSSSYHK